MEWHNITPIHIQERIKHASLKLQRLHGLFLPNFEMRAPYIRQQKKEDRRSR